MKIMMTFRMLIVMMMMLMWLMRINILTKHMMLMKITFPAFARAWSSSDDDFNDDDDEDVDCADKDSLSSICLSLVGFWW